MPEQHSVSIGTAPLFELSSSCRETLRHILTCTSSSTPKPKVKDFIVIALPLKFSSLSIEPFQSFNAGARPTQPQPTPNTQRRRRALHQLLSSKQKDSGHFFSNLYTLCDLPLWRPIQHLPHPRLITTTPKQRPHVRRAVHL